MAARLIGLIASRGDDLRAQLLAAGALDGLMTALGAMDAVASVGGPLPVPSFPVLSWPYTMFRSRGCSRCQAHGENVGNEGTASTRFAELFYIFVRQHHWQCATQGAYVTSRFANCVLAGAVLQGGKSAAGGLVPAFTVHHELGMQHQIATGLLHLCSVAGATAQQPGVAQSRCPGVNFDRMTVLRPELDSLYAFVCAIPITLTVGSLRALPQTDGSATPLICDRCRSAIAEPAAAASPAATSSSRHETGGKEADHAAHGQHESAALRGERLVGELVGAGAVPPLLRLRGLGFPRCAPAVTSLPNICFRTNVPYHQIF